MSKVSSWLSENGFSQYLDSFESNDITFDLLGELSQSDLKELGLSLGHQKKFLRSVKELVQPATAITEIPSAERRQLTVMFCDLVDSTHLVNKIGAEDMQDVFRDYQEVCKQAVNRYNGYIANYLGDGVVVFFGYPQAHERDADRCVRAGLLLLELIKPINQKYQRKLDISVEVRIGIATGPVVVGDVIGEGSSLQTSVVGETPNLAARIESLGERDTVTISDLTRKLVSSTFQFEDHGQHHAKGFPDLVQVWKVGAEGRVDKSLHSSAIAKELHLSGRTDELLLLHERWSKVTEGKGELVSVSGEAGIGKSHLVGVFINQSACVGGSHIELQCSPYYTGSVLYPILDQIEQEIEKSNLKPGGTRQALTTQDLTDHFSGMSEWSAEAVSYFGSLISPETPPEVLSDDLSAQSLQMRAFDAWIDLIAKRAEESPVIVHVEDAHWLDSTSIELISRLVSRMHNIGCMLLISFRPEFVSPWKGYRCVATELPLSRLDRAHGLKIIERVAPDAVLKDEVVDLILDRTDGIPLFIEELTKTLLQQHYSDKKNKGSQSDTNNGDGIGLAGMEIPESLNDLLMSRLDKEPSVKYVTQIGAAIGRDFAYRLLASIAPQEEKELRVLLERVVDSDLVFESGPRPTPIYTFRHALLQDAAYQSLLKRNRRSLHEKIAEAMESSDESIASSELLAHHWTEAQRPEKAVGYWHQAAREAKRLWANAESVKRYRNALRSYNQLSESEQTESQQTDELKLDLLLELGDALRAVSGSSAAETIAVFDQAARICAAVDNIDYAVRSYYGAFTCSFNAAKLEIAKTAAEELLDKSNDSEHRAGIAAGHQALGMHAFAKGELESARDNLELALASKDSYQFDFDIQFPVLSQIYLSWTLYLLGHEAKARDLSNLAIEEAEPTSPYNRALVMANACYLYQFRKDTEGLAMLTDALKQLCVEKGLPVWYGVADFFDCWQKCQNEPTDENLDALVKALTFWAEDEIETPYFKAIVAETLIENGRETVGLDLASEATHLARETGEMWYEEFRANREAKG